MVSEVIQQRFAGIFDSLDRNGDGFIDETDLEMVVSALAGLRGVEPGSPEHDAMRDKVMSSWAALRDLGDTDRDGRITRDEYIQSLAKMVETPEGLDRAALGIADQMIIAMDSDGDGKLDRNEYRGMMGAWGAPEERMDVLFDHMDADGDGYVTREELLASMRKFFYDEGTQAPHLWGAEA